jgi:hypothetical protein
MSDTPRTPQDPPEPPRVEDFEPPAIIALGKLDEVTFGAAGPPFEGATSYF